MAMHNPPHPGGFITEYLEDNNVSLRKMAKDTGRLSGGAEQGGVRQGSRQPRNGGTA